MKNWVIKVLEKWQDRYDFSKIEFGKRDDIIKLICEKHGEFETTGSRLIKSKKDVCPLCIKEGYKDRKEKSKQTMLKKYGVDNAMHVKEFRQKLTQTMQDRYGVDNIMKNPDIVKKVQKTNLERYGATSYLGSKEGFEKICQTNLKKYGSLNFMQSDIPCDVINQMNLKRKKTCMDKYGEDHYSKSNDYKINSVIYKAKEIETKRKNGTLSTSDTENIIYDLLVDKFGEKNVIREYKSDLYPFSCDFYIKSIDLYIELNAHWSHGFEFFDDNLVGTDFYNKFKEKASESEYYKNAFKTWTERDVLKWQTAKRNNLNYLVFWDNMGRDFTVWLASDCPMGKDYGLMYSWLPDVDFVDNHDYNLTDSYFQLYKIMKKYQYDVFYKNEIKLWYKNPMRSHIKQNMWLYYNRLKYINKTPFELNGKEILRGFRISGISQGYTVFDNRMMKKFIENYNIKSVFDPFAGWGERLLTCGINDIIYDGVDIRDELEDGYKNMIDRYNLDTVSFTVMDSEDFNMNKKYDAVITCPPYLDTEIYSDVGMENMNKDEFGRKIIRLFKKCYDNEIKYIGLQTNQYCKEYFINWLLEAGYKFVEQYDLKKMSSHFVKKTKKEFESFLVLERV